MKKTIILSSIVAVILMLLCMFFCIYKHNAIHKARSEDTLESYLSYYRRFSSGDFSKVAYDSIVSKSKRTGRLSLFDSLITEFPHSSIGEDLMPEADIIITRFLIEAANENTLESWMRLSDSIPDYYYNLKYKDVVDSNLREVCDLLFESTKEKRDLEAWHSFVRLLPQDIYTKYYEDKVDEIKEELYDDEYDKALKTGTIKGWEKYKDIVPPFKWKDPNQQIDRIKQQQSEAKWRNESTAWKEACASDRISDYEKYLELHPKGAHSGQAEKRLIDLDVAAVFAGEHGNLPPMEKRHAGGGHSTVVTIHNSTSYTLSLSYSGPSSKRVSISAGRNKTITLSNGEYGIAARVYGGRVTPYAGTEYLSGGSYEVTYYIETIRY